MKKITTIRKVVCTIANQLHKQGHNKSNAFIIAWNTVKHNAIYTKVSGLTFANRQEALKRLLMYPREAVTVTVALIREYWNIHDKNAVAIQVTVKGKGSYILGYLNRQKASLIAPLLDKGITLSAYLKDITGQRHNTYGANLELRLIA